MSKKSNYPISDHFDGKVFFNPTLPTSHVPGFKSVLKMLFTSKRKPWPNHVINQAKPQPVDEVPTNEAVLTFVNHATFLIQLPGLNILTDPVWSKRVSPLTFIGPARVREPGIALEKLPKIDLILLSHNHYDHLDSATLKKLATKFNPTIMVPLGDYDLVNSLGFKKIHELDWWQEIIINPQTKIIFTPTQHFSARSLTDKCRSLWGGYIIKQDEHQIYFGGDAGYSRHYEEINKRYGAIDLALIGIGAYLPSWFMRPMHMNPKEAVRAHHDLAAKQSIGMHYGTFQLSDEAIDQPVKDLQEAVTQAGMDPDKFTVMQDGETRRFYFTTD